MSRVAKLSARTGRLRHTLSPRRAALQSALSSIDSGDHALPRASLIASRVNSLVGAVYVLSVRTFSDRIAHIEAELARHGIVFEWIFEHDADELTAETIDRVFAPSDLTRRHQSLVLKHIETWKRCVSEGHERVLVFEDDAVLARDFERVFAAAMSEADRLTQPYLIYLGCGDNKYAEAAKSSLSQLVRPDLELPAADATVFDRHAAELRLQYISRGKITRPADWLIREADAELGVIQWWLREPIVEQGSMNGRFASALDDKRIERGQHFNRFRFRWDKLRRRWLGSTRPAAAWTDVGEDRKRVRRDFWAISTARGAAAIALIGLLVSPPLTNAAAAVMLIAFALAPSARVRLTSALRQPLGSATVILMVVLAMAMLWSIAPWRQALSAWTSWRYLILIVIGLAIFDERTAKLRFALAFVVAATIGAFVSYIAYARGVSYGPSDLMPGIVMRNHVTQGIGLAVASMLAAVLGFLAPPQSRLRWFAFGVCLLLAANVVFISYGRSGHLALLIFALVGVLGLLRGRARISTLIAVVAISTAVVAVSPTIKDRFVVGWHEFQDAGRSEVITPMGIRAIMWDTSAQLVRERPLLGYGLGGFAPAYQELTAKVNSGWRARVTLDPHNQYLFIVAETGLLGLFVFAFWLASALRQPVRGPFRIVGVALLVSWCVTSLFSSHFQTFTEGHMIALLLGAFLARENLPQAVSAASTAASTSS